jgi:hypothetical protein
MNNRPKQREIAEALGLSPGRISQLRADGMPTTSIEAARDWYRRRVDQVRSFGARRGAGLAGSAPGSAAPALPEDAAGGETEVSYEEARRRREVADAYRAELRLAEEAGKLVRRDAVNRMLFTASRVMRDQLLALAPRLAATVAPITDAKAIELRLDEEIRVALWAFAQQQRADGYQEHEPGGGGNA